MKLRIISTSVIVWPVTSRCKSKSSDVCNGVAGCITNRVVEWPCHGDCVVCRGGLREFGKCAGSFGVSAGGFGAGVVAGAIFAGAGLLCEECNLSQSATLLTWPPQTRKFVELETVVSLPKRRCNSCKAPKLLSLGKNCGIPFAGLNSSTALTTAQIDSPTPATTTVRRNAIHNKRCQRVPAAPPPRVEGDIPPSACSISSFMNSPWKSPELTRRSSISLPSMPSAAQLLPPPAAVNPSAGCAIATEAKLGHQRREARRRRSCPTSARGYNEATTIQFAVMQVPMKKPNWRKGPMELATFAKKLAAVVADVAKIANPALRYIDHKRRARAISPVP
mmetsp:Transcript_31837/g.80071  ORF Transcript_31837/g.80071 Transcript_31837/m.80071 type:complete len:335 (-) Transcript_31837:205-1209(-)